LQATREVPKMAMTKQKTVGIRVPDHPVTQALLRELGHPLITATAKLPGGEPLYDPWEIGDCFPTLDLVMAVDRCGMVPATVVDLTDGEVRVIREGAGPVDALR